MAKYFDFLHATPYFKRGKIIASKAALSAILGKELIYIGSLYPFSALVRLRKFIKRGWTLSGGTALKLWWNLSEFDPSDPLVLADQLAGVDVQLLGSVVQWLKDRPEATITKEWIDDLVKRIFEEE